MGVKYMKDKPETDSFAYAYVEDSDGRLVRIAKEKMKEVLGIVDPVDTEISLFANGWTLSEDSTHHTQSVVMENITANSKVELMPTPQQVIQLFSDETTIFIGNADGTIIAYAVNGVPSVDMTFRVRITEVV